VNLYPILLDSRPSYLEGSRSSLLLVPLGTGTLLDHLRARLSAVSPNALAVCPTFEPDPDYAAAAGNAPKPVIAGHALGGSARLSLDGSSRRPPLLPC
jgi:hypothetical protein